MQVKEVNMLEEIAHYGKVKCKEEHEDCDNDNTVDNFVVKEQKPYNPYKWGSDIFNPFARYGI